MCSCLAGPKCLRSSSLIWYPSFRNCSMIACIYTVFQRMIALTTKQQNGVVKLDGRIDYNSAGNRSFAFTCNAFAILKSSLRFGKYTPRSTFPIQPSETPDFCARVCWLISFTRRKYLIWWPIMIASNDFAFCFIASKQDDT